MKLPRIMLGANPFHGVSYKSSAQRKEYRQRFSKVESIQEIMERSLQLGVRAIHVYTKEVELQAVYRTKIKYGDKLIVVAVLPDIYGALSRQAGVTDRRISTNLAQLKVLLKNSTSFISAGIKGDLLPLVKKALDTELKLLKKVEPNFVILHGMLTDIVCATDRRELLELFLDRVGRYGALPGLATHNLVTLAQGLKQMGLTVPVIMAPFNLNGFLMNPSPETCIQTMNAMKEQTVFIAKKVLAGGVIEPFKAQKYIFDELNLPAAIGIGNTFEIEKTFLASKEILGQRFYEDIELPL